MTQMLSAVVVADLNIYSGVQIKAIVAPIAKTMMLLALIVVF